MLKDAFNMSDFNLYSDDEYYYFFRALEDVDIQSIKNRAILDKDGNITRLMTDREFYGEENKFKEHSSISLEEVFSHIKMHYNRHTNCISFTSNANTVLTYGRQDYEDKYVMLKVPKKEFGKNVVSGSLYMFEEIEKEVEKYISNSKLNSLQTFYLNAIDNAKTKEELEEIKSTLPKEYLDIDDNIFEEGINYIPNFTDSSDYQTLDEKRNLMKNKLILKIDVLGKNIIPNVSNKFLIQTLGSSFASQEIIHYKDVPGDKLITVSKEMMDVLAIVQQLPIPNVTNDLKRLLIKYINNNKNINLSSFDRENDHLKSDITIDNMYRLTNGSMSYLDASKIYIKSYYVAKSKLRCLNTCKLLRNITNDNPKYKELIDYIENNCYSVEPEISTRLNKRGIKLSEGVNLNVNNKELELVNKLSNFNEEKLKYILDNPLSVVKELINNDTYKLNMSKEEYFANSIIDLFDFESLGIQINFSNKQRQDIIDKLIENNIVDVYYKLKEKGIKEKDIANILLTAIVKNKDINNLDIHDTFTLSELESFIGYNKVKDTSLILRNYQRIAYDNINKNFSNHKYTTAVLPTGAGKSFVALAQMYKYRNNNENKGILYLAPNVEILNQIKDYIWKYYANKTITKSVDELIQEVFPGITFATYSYLDSINASNIINHKYNLIVCDELHRTGATIFNSNLNKLFKNQNKNTKILGITATPLRDVDSKNMAKYWAKYFDYTDEEITKQEYLSINLDLFEAIERGYVVNPKVIFCEYNLLKDGHMQSLLEIIQNIKNEEEQSKMILKYEELRRKLEAAKGIEEILSDNIKPGGKYIVFCPVKNQKGVLVDDENIDSIDKITTINNMKQYMEDLKRELKLFADKNNLSFDKDIEITSMLGLYTDKENETNLNNFNKNDPNKTKFIVVINKLNEGVHVNNIDGIIWKRPLDALSRILYLQQLGRCIFGLDPIIEYTDEDRPTVIDLVNNTLNVVLDKEETILSGYLDRMYYIYAWYKIHNKIPNLNSLDVDESKLGMSLKDIKTRFEMYLDNEELFKTLSIDEELSVRQILFIGMEMDIWNYDFEQRDKLSTSEKLNIYIDMLNHDYKPYYYDPYNNFEGTSIRINGFLKTNIDILIIPKLFFDLKDDEMYNVAREKILKILKIKSIEEYLNKKDEEDTFTLTGLMKDFHEFEKEVKSIEPSFIDRLNEIKKLGYIPITSSEVRFNDNSTYIGSWIAKHKEQLIRLSKTNDIALWIAKEKGWLITLEDRLKEIKELGYVPKVADTIRFKDGTAYIGRYIEITKDSIMKLISTDDIALWIATKKGWLNNITLEDRLKEIKELGYVPKVVDTTRFKDDTAYIGKWIHYKEVKEKIIELSKTNDIAKWIVKEKGWLNNITLEDRLKEIKELGYVPKKSDMVRFKDGSASIYSWIQNRKKVIKKLYETNDIAKWIGDSVGWFTTIESRLEEIKELGYVPKSINRAQFKDGTIISSWLNKKEIKEKILELSKTNETAAWIVKEKRWLTSFEGKLEEIKELGYVPNTNREIRFKNGNSHIGHWLTDNKMKIIELSKTNEIAKWIVKEKKWSITLEERLEEIKELGYVPFDTDKIKFKDDSCRIGIWIGKNKEKILELSKTNETALEISKKKGWIVNGNKKIFKKNIKNLQRQMLMEFKSVLETIDGDKKLIKEDIKKLALQFYNKI